jgi:hypothetical protein
MQEIIPIVDSYITLTPYDWPLTRDNREEIDRYWQYRISRQPRLFNGEMCLLKSWSIESGILVGKCFNTDYKTFLWWREHDRPHRNVFDFFGAAALHTQENWLILGRMADQTASKGWMYPPCGSPIPTDFVDGKLDIDGSLMRETLEETGIELSRPQLGSALLLTDEARIVYVRPVRLDIPASTLMTDINRFIANQAEPELARVEILAGQVDIPEKGVPGFVSIYVRHRLG